MKKLYLILLILSSFNTTFTVKIYPGKSTQESHRNNKNNNTSTRVDVCQEEKNKNNLNNLKVLNIVERRKETKQDKALMSRIKNSELSASMRAIVWSCHYPY